jgi:hypothetical protein
MMAAVSTAETPVNFYKIHGALFNKKAIFIFAALRT